MLKLGLVLAFELVLGCVLGCGGVLLAAAFGFPWWVGLALSGLCFFIMSVRFEMEKQDARAKAVKDAFDRLVDQGNPPVVGGKPWQTSWRIDPSSGAVICKT